MHNPEDRAGFDQTWSQAINDYQTSPGGMLSGKVLGHNKDGTLRVQIDSLGVVVTASRVRKAAGGVVGPGTGQIDVPAIGSEVKLVNNQGRGYGYANNFVTVGNAFSSDFPHPTHPSLLDPNTGKPKLGVYGYQGGVVAGNNTTPASVQFHDTQGGYSSLTMGKHTERKYGAKDSSADGPAATADDISGIKAGAGVAKASATLNSLGSVDVENTADLQNLSAKLGSVSSDLGLSAMSASNAARSFSSSVVKQGEALSISSWAENAGMGESEPNEFI